VSKHKGTENTEYAKAMQELRRSNAAGTHRDKRERRKRTRKEKREAAIKDTEA